MTTLLCNFGRSGDLENDVDDHARDHKFFTQYAKGDPMWFWIYMAWDHGRNVPAWNVAMLPESESLDLGVGDTGGTSEPAPPARQPKRARAPEIRVSAGADSELEKLMAMSTKWMDLAMASQASQSSAATTNSQPLDAEEHRADSMRFLIAQLKHLQESLELLPPPLHANVHNAIEKVRCVMHAA